MIEGERLGRWEGEIKPERISDDRCPAFVVVVLNTVPIHVDSHEKNQI